jgi:hypothetical protein
MREEQPMRGDVGSEAGRSDGPGPLVVVSPTFGTFARTSLWVRQTVEGQELIAIPRLHVEQQAAIAIAGGQGLGKVFKDCRIVTPEWEDIAGFVGGSWQLWKTARSELLGVGFVRGNYNFDIERAVRGITKLLT